MADTMSKIVAFGGVALVGYITYNKIVNDKSKPDKRKHKVQSVLSDMDKQVNDRNSAFGQKLKANPLLPTASRYNFERRRRPSYLH